MFCAATGFAGTPKVGTGRFEPERLVPVENAGRIKVHFNADRSEQLPWSFVPQQKFVSVLPGETSLAFYRAKNDSDKDIIGIATYNVTPDRVSFIPIFPCAQNPINLSPFNRLRPTFRKSNVSVSKSSVFWPAKKWICHFYFSLTKTCWTILRAEMLKMLCSLIPSSGTSHSYFFPSFFFFNNGA
jgi:hypothetical protein